MSSLYPAGSGFFCDTNDLPLVQKVPEARWIIGDRNVLQRGQGEDFKVKGTKFFVNLPIPRFDHLDEGY